MKAFLTGKSPSPIPALAPSAAASRQALPVLGSVRAAPAQGAGTHIEAIKEGDKVVRLVITCVCGERIEVECLYPAG
jgi:hypothetical protein